MSTLQSKKNKISKIVNNYKFDSIILMDMIYNWTRQGELERHEFQEILNLARLAISRNGKKNYSGNEDPESIMG